MKKIEVVAGIIYYDNKILCMQRGVAKSDYMSFKFEFPGGKVEPNESNVDALKRELNEELDMNAIVTDDDYFMTVDHFYTDKEVVMHAYKCKVETDKFNLKEHISFKWLNLDELDSLDWAQADIPIKNKLMEEG